METVQWSQAIDFNNPQSSPTRTQSFEDETIPENETQSQYIARVRREWVKAEKEFVAKSGSKFIPWDVAMSQRVDKYDVGESKIRAIEKVAEKFPDHTVKRTGDITREEEKKIAAKLEKLGMKPEHAGYQRAFANEAIKISSKRAESYLDDVRDAVFSVLEVDDGEKMAATDERFQYWRRQAPHLMKSNGYKEKVDPKLQARFEMVKSRIAKATAVPSESSDVEFQLGLADADARKVQTAHFSEGYGVTAYGKSRGQPSMAHEIGHAISGGMTPKNNSTVGSSISKWRFDKAVASDKILMDEIVDSVGKHGAYVYPVPSVGDDGRCGMPYATAQAKYVKKIYPGGASEVPSVLLEYFYNDPITFVNRMPKRVTKLIIGFLDGALR